MSNPNKNEVMRERLFSDDPDAKKQAVEALNTFVRVFVEDKPWYRDNIPSTNLDDKHHGEPAHVVDGWFPVYVSDFEGQRDCRETFVDRMRRLTLRNERAKRKAAWEASWDGKPHSLQLAIELLPPFYRHEIYRMLHRKLLERGPGGIKFDYHPGLPEDIADIFDEAGDGYEQLT